MKKEMMIEWMTEGHVSIPAALFKHYADIGLDEAECMLVLQIHAFKSEGNPFPTPEQLSERMSISSEKCISMLRSIVKKGALALEHHQDESNGVYSESYSLMPLWDKLLFYYFKNQQQPAKQDENLFSLFEQEFGRPLSPIECEQMSMWKDDDEHSDELVKMALKEAVMAGIMNFRYIDRILLEWKKKGIRSVEQAKQFGEKFRRNKPNQQESKSKKDPFPFYNWLEK